MEWNQAVCKEQTVNGLTGEIIRIGALMFDEDLNEIARHYSCVIPKFYKQMNKNVGKLTGLKNSAITYGMSFPNAIACFVKWIGDEECIILTWGSEDEKIMRSNLAAYKLTGVKLPEFYDVQRIYGNRITKDNKQYALTAALGQMQLPTELPPHNALNDAIYTARLAKAAGLLSYLPEYDVISGEIEEYRRLLSEVYYLNIHENCSRESILKSDKVNDCLCPVCDIKMKRQEFIFHKDNCAVSYAECPEHGEYYIKLKIKECPDGGVSVTRKMKILTPQNRAFYRAKAEEAEARKAAQLVGG